MVTSLSAKKTLHRFFNSIITGGMDPEDTTLQTGHDCVLLSAHQVVKQPLQKQWLQGRTTGSLKMSRHTGQLRFSSNWEAIFSLIKAGNTTERTFNYCHKHILLSCSCKKISIQRLFLGMATFVYLFCVTFFEALV